MHPMFHFTVLIKSLEERKERLKPRERVKDGLLLRDLGGNTKKPWGIDVSQSHMRDV